MSLDLFIQKFERGVSNTFSKTQIKKSLGKNIVSELPESWEVRFSADDGGTFYTGSDELIESLNINRPLIGIKLFEFLSVLLHSGNYVLFSPGLRNPLVGSLDVITHIPEDMISSLGQPLVVTSGKDIKKALIA
jgi:hypothetical protein